MTDDSNNRLQQLFHAASRLPRQEQRAWLEQQCGDDETLLHEVMSLLEQDLSTEDRLDSGMREVGKQAEGLRRVLAIGSSDEPDETCQENSTPKAPAEPRALNRVGKTVGPYKLLQRIGEGGMGTVYMAQQDKPVRRRVALKIIKPGLDTKQVIARFEAERQALAMMDHNHIARVLDAGATEDGHPYFAMELVKGIAITQYCDDNKLTVEERLELFIPVCHAIQHAHQKGIIHRDIKPSNVLVSMHDGKPVPKVIDFGVAKATHQKLTEKTMFTALGQVVGTLEYMSPEQAEMNQLDIDTRSDVYSLGVMLYELLTGTTPITSDQLRNAGISEVLKTIRQHEPPKPSTRLSESSDTLPAVSTLRKTEPSRLSRMLRGDLDWIVMKTLEKDRTRRYETANGLAADISRYLSGDPVEAGPPSASYRLQRFASKYRSLLVTGMAVSAVLLIATCLSLWLAYRMSVAQGIAVDAEELASTRLQALTEEQKKTEAALETSQRETKRAEINAERAIESEQEARRLLYRSNMREAVVANQKYDVGRVRELLLEHAPQAGETDYRDFAWYHLWKSTHPYDRLLPHGAPIVDMDLSTDGQYVATVSSDGICRISDVETGTPVGRLDVGNRIGNTIRFSPDGQWISTTGYTTRTATIWNWQSGEQEFTLKDQPAYVVRSCWTPDRESIASVRWAGGNIWFHDAKSGDLQKKLETSIGASRNLIISSDGRFLAATDSHNRDLLILDLSSEEEIALERPEGGWNDEYDGDLQFSPDSTRLLSCGKGGITLWEAATGKQIAHMTDDTVPWQTIAFRPDGKTFFAAGDKKLVECDARTLNVLRRHPAHAGRIVEMAITPDGRQLITAGTDGVVQIRDLWPTDSSEILRRRTAFAQFLQSGELLAVGWNNDFALLDTSAQTVRSLANIKHLVATIGEDGQLLATGQRDGAVELWDMQTGKLTRAFDLVASDPQWSDAISALAFHPDSGLLAVTTSGYQAFLIDTRTHQLKQKIRSSRAQAVDIAPNGKTITVPSGVSGESDSHLEVYSIDTGALLRRTHHSSGSIRAIAHSDDSSLLASAGTEMVIRVTPTEAQLDKGFVLRGHTATVRALSFSPDGQLLASGDNDGVIRVWSIAERTAIDIIQTESPSIRSLDFSPDGTTLAAAGDAGIELLQTAPDKQILGQLQVDQFLARDDWAGLFRYLAETESRPEWNFNTIDAYLKEMLVAFSANDTDKAGALIDQAIELLEILKTHHGQISQGKCDQAIYNLLLTKAGILLRDNQNIACIKLCEEAMANGGYRNVTSGYRHTGGARNWIAQAALSEYRKKLVNEAAQPNRMREFSRLLLDGYYWFYMTVRDEEGKQSRIWSGHQLPKSDFAIIDIGTGGAIPAACLTQFEFEWLAQQPELHSMSIDMPEVPGGFWEGLSRMKQLQSLGLIDWSGRSESDLAALSKMTNLQNLTVDASFAGCEQLHLLAGLEHLESFTMQHGWLTRADADGISKLPHLNTLNLSWGVLDNNTMAGIANMQQLEELYIDATSVTTAGLKLLERHPSLQRVDLFEVPVGDDVAESLSKVPNLKVAGLLNTEVTLSGVEKLQQALPDCVVMHQLGPLVVGKNGDSSIMAPPGTTYFPPLSAGDPTLTEMLAAAAAANNPPRISGQTCLLMEGAESAFKIGPFQLDPNKGMTIEAWARPTGYSLAAPFGDDLFQAQTGPESNTWFHVRVTANHTWAMTSEPHELGEFQSMGGGFANDGRLVHLAAVVSPEKMTLFVDGKRTATKPLSEGILGETWKFAIGHAFDRYFQGLVDEVRISNAIRYTEDFVPQREFDADEQTVALYHFDAHPRGIVFDSSLALRHVEVKPKYVKLAGEPSPQADQSESDTNSASAEHLASLEQIDPIKLPRLKPWVEYHTAPDRAPTRLTSLSCNGRDSGFRMPEVRLNVADGITMEAWVRSTAMAKSKWGGIVLEGEFLGEAAARLVLKINQDQKWFVMLKPDENQSKEGAYLSDKQVAYANPIEDTPWTHVATVLKGESLSLFVNGKQVAKAKIAANFANKNLTLSTVAGQGDEQLIGFIDEVRISSTARYTEDFEKPLKENEFEPDEHTTILYHFDENQDRIIYDYSGYNHHVEHKNAVWAQAK